MPNEQREYIILGDFSSHHKDSGDEFFRAALHPLRYVDLANPTIIKKPDISSKNSHDFTSLYWYVCDEKNIEASLNRFKKHSIYKVLVEEKIFEGPYGKYSLSFIVDNSEIEVKNKLLEDFLDEYKTPTIIEDAVLGTLTAENSEACLSGNIKWNNIDVEIGLEIESIEKTKEMSAGSKSWDKKFKDALAEEYFEDAKEYFEEDEKNTSKEEFAEYFILESIFVHKSGEFYASFNSEVYLADHTIYINGNLDEGIIDITLEG